MSMSNGNNGINNEQQEIPKQPTLCFTNLVGSFWSVFALWHVGVGLIWCWLLVLYCNYDLCYVRYKRYRRIVVFPLRVIDF